MGAIYIGSGQKKKNGGANWKLYAFLVLFGAVTGPAIKFSAPILAERWINENGTGKNGFAFSVRDVELSLMSGEVLLNDVKVFNPKTDNKLLESPVVKLQYNWPERKVTVTAEKADLILSRDLSSELARVKLSIPHVDLVEGKFGKLNIIEKKEYQGRTVVVLNAVNLNVKEFKEFGMTSTIADGGKLQLSGKSAKEWSIQGKLKQVPADFFNQIAGDKLPFTFNEATLDAAISAQSEQGKLTGEITPDIRKLNLIEEKPGFPVQSIARLLSEELSFTLPFTVKDEVKLQYEETFRKLKAYRKYPAATESAEVVEAAKVTQVPNAKKSFSLWPF